MMEPRISFITLGVTDLQRATAFYTGVLELTLLPSSNATVSFFDLGGIRLALYTRHRLAADAGVALTSGDDSRADGDFAGFSLAHNVRQREQVDELLAHVEQQGGRILKRGKPADWGGYAGYFADPDGFIWEVAWNPRYPIV